MVRVLVMVATESDMMAIAPIGSGFNMTPTIVAMKIASRCQPCGVSSSGLGQYQIAMPIRKVIIKGDCLDIRCFM